jgi:hypothetical protein
MLEIIVNPYTYYLSCFEYNVVYFFPLQVKNKPHEEAFECAFFMETVNTAVNSTNAMHRFVTPSEAVMGLASHVQAAPPLLESPPRIEMPPNHSAVASGFAHRPLLACSGLNSITTDSRFRWFSTSEASE